MGIAGSFVTFESPLPDLAEIVERITEITGQPVAVIEPEGDGEPDLYDLRVGLELASAPRTRIRLEVYRPGVVRDHCEKTEFPMPEIVTGHGETETRRTVYLRTYVGQQPALYHATLLALESLGGRPAYPIAEDVRRRHAEPVTDARAAGWRREPKAASVLGALIWVLLVPWVILTGCVTVLMFLVTLPALVWKVVRAERGGSR